MSAGGASVPGTALPGAPLVGERLAAIRSRLAAAGGDPGAVAVVAVTKGFPPGIVAAATGAGLDELGENYAQELAAKVDWLAAQGSAPAVRWQFIGQLQRRKVRLLAPHVARWQSVDRVDLVDELARRAPGARLFVQVNTTSEPQKAGCAPQEAAPLVARAQEAGLEVEGLMAVGPTDPTVDPAPAFAGLRRLVDGLGLRHCSMGMTDDLEVAVREGSTMIRVGRALFGPRPPRRHVGN